MPNGTNLRQPCISSACVVLAYVAYFHGNFPGGIFSKDGEVISAAVDYMRACAIDSCWSSSRFAFSATLTGAARLTEEFVDRLISVSSLLLLKKSV